MWQAGSKKVGCVVWVMSLICPQVSRGRRRLRGGVGRSVSAGRWPQWMEVLVPAGEVPLRAQCFLAMGLVFAVDLQGAMAHRRKPLF